MREVKDGWVLREYNMPYWYVGEASDWAMDLDEAHVFRDLSVARHVAAARGEVLRVIRYARALMEEVQDAG